MKKLLNIFVAFLTGLIGVLAYYVLFFFMPVSIPEIKEVTALYKLEAYPQVYVSRKVILQEDLIAYRNRDNNSLSYYIQGHKERCDFFISCSNVKYLDCMITKYLNFKTKVEKNEVAMIEEIAEKNRQLSENSSLMGVIGAKVEIECYVRSSDILDNYFTIDVINIKQISPIRFISEEEMNKPK